LDRRSRSISKDRTSFATLPRNSGDAGVRAAEKVVQGGAEDYVLDACLWVGNLPEMALLARRVVRFFFFVSFLAGTTSGGAGEERSPTPVVIPNVKGTATTTKFGAGYLTRSSDGTRYTTSKFGDGWITRSSKGESFTTTKFGDGAITRGGGQRVTTSRFGSGTISRSSDGTTTTTQKFGQGSVSRSTSGAGVTTSKFGSGFISRESKPGGSKDKAVVRVIPAPPAR